MHKHICNICHKEFYNHQKDGSYFCSRTCMGFSYRKYARERVCEQCGKAFTQNAPRRGKVQKFCTPECAQKHKIKKRPILKCKQCGKEFSADRASRELSRKFCSDKCYQKSSRTRMYKEKKCLNCGKTFYRPRPNVKFCCGNCYKNFISEYWDEVGWKPGYNTTACKYFKQFDKEHNTKGEYATNGGERHIDGTNYWVDYYNPDLKLIIEWDEKSHFSEKRHAKDTLRQEAIQQLLPEFQFARIDERQL